MCDNEGNKRNYIFDNLFDCRQPHQHIHLKGKKYHNTQIQKFFF